MTERENALKAFHHQKPDWIPLTYDAVQEIGFGGGTEDAMCNFITNPGNDRLITKYHHISLWKMIMCKGGVQWSNPELMYMRII